MDKAKFPIEIEVTAYSGYRADERPLSFPFEGSRKNVERIIKQWREPGKERFKVLADDGKAYLLCLQRGSDAWFLEKIYETYSGI
jgi:hypothetical protein